MTGFHVFANTSGGAIKMKKTYMTTKYKIAFSNIVDNEAIKN